ncbi:MAG TPA: flagellar hook-basal body complex protein, partial [Burkholderiaceae bacterium]|nr:flagellar hook-basal body complex protein [Burkholderiaceae bacterium]
YDSLGNSHQLTQYFVKREAEAGVSVWSVYYRLNGQPIDNSVLDGTTELRFDKAGKLLEPIQPVAIEFSLAAGGSPAETLQISVDYAGSTQFGGGFTPDYLQNGYATGEYAALNFAADGSIVASYTNGKTIKTGTITLAHFNNLQGLRPVGGNAWIETSESGPAILGTPGSMGFSTIKGQALEDSNVDIGNELVNMIITQRIYQANAQTISTQNEMMQTLINMR